MLEKTTIDDQPCVVQYLDIDLNPTHKSNHTFQYIRFSDGKLRYKVGSNDPCAWHVYNSLSTPPMHD